VILILIIFIFIIYYIDLFRKDHTTCFSSALAGHAQCGYWCQFYWSKLQLAK